MSQKGFTPIVGLILGLALISAIGIYQIYKSKTNPQIAKLVQNEMHQATPTPQATINETSNWKTYRDSDQLFEVKFPENWQLNSKTGCGGPAVTDPENLKSSLSICSYSFGSTPGAEKLTETFIGSNELISKETFSLDENSAIKVTFKDGEVGVRTYILIDYEKYGDKEPFTLYIRYTENSQDLIYKDQEVFDQILATFKFLP